MFQANRELDENKVVKQEVNILREENKVLKQDVDVLQKKNNKLEEDVKTVSAYYYRISVQILTILL